jgi:outer membrane protein assembly factor BamB
MGRNASACMFRGPLMLAGNLVLSGSASMAHHTGKLRALDLTTGRQRWAQAAGRGLVPSLTRLGRRVLVPTLDGELWCLDVDSGERLWTVPLRVGAWGSLAVGVDRVYAGSQDGSLSALDVETGRIVWRTPLGAPITTAVRRGNRALFVGTRDGRLHRVDLWDGTVLASRQIDARLAPRSAPLVQPDALVVQLGNDDDSQQALISIDRSLRRERWRITASEHWTTARAFAWKDTVAVGTAFGDVRAFCSADGSLAWTHRLPGTVRTIAGAGDTLYIGTTDGRVQAMKPPSTCAN